jgi:hypothetical protein
MRAMRLQRRGLYDCGRSAERLTVFCRVETPGDLDTNPGR